MSPEQAAAILRLSQPWTLDGLKKAFKRRARETHPDVSGSDDDEAFKQAHLAFKCLEEHLKGGGVDYPGFDEDLDEEVDEEEQDDLDVGAWFDVLGVRCGRKVVDAVFRAQLVELKHKKVNLYGEAISTRLLMAVYADRGVELESDLVEVVLRERGMREPSLFVRKVVQRSYDMKNKISAFWFDPLADPVISEENVYSHGRYEPPRAYEGYYWWDVIH